MEYGRKIDNNEFSIEDVPSFIEDYFNPKNRRFRLKNHAEFRNKLNKIKGLLVQYYKCEEDEICIDDIIFNELDFEKNPYKVILGNADFENSRLTDVGELQIICGNANFRCSKITSLGNLQRIGGNANFVGLEIEDLGDLQVIGGHAEFRYTELTSLGNLQRIGGDVDFSDSQITDLKNLKNIGGEIRGSEELKKQYEEMKRKGLTGQDIGKIGFGIGVELCDEANKFMSEQIRSEEIGDEIRDE